MYTKRSKISGTGRTARPAPLRWQKGSRAGNCRCCLARPRGAAGYQAPRTRWRVARLETSCPLWKLGTDGGAQTLHSRVRCPGHPDRPGQVSAGSGLVVGG